MRVPGLTILSGVLLAAALTLPAHADGVEDFYKDRTVTLIAGYSSGGGFDLYARVVANHLGRHIPGQPRIIVQNMPGAGSMRAANHLYNVAPKDGSVISLTRAPVIEPLVGANGAAFDADEVHLARQRRQRSHGLRPPRQSQGQQHGGRQADRVHAGRPRTRLRRGYVCQDPRKLLGLKIHLVSGYPGGAELNLAVERGELDGRCGWAYSSIKISKPDWIAEKKIKLLNVLALERSPELPDVPAIMEFATSERQKQIFKFVLNAQTLGRPFAARPFRPIAPPPCARPSTPPWPTRRCWPR